jgi:hypothetical protein
MQGICLCFILTLRIMLNKEVDMKYEIRSRETGKVVYEGNTKDPAGEWNAKKRLMILGMDSDKKLLKHIEKYGFYDFELHLVSEEKPKKVDEPKKRNKKK